MTADPSVKFELSHINSIQTIPAKARPKVNNAIYLVNEPVINACLGLDRDLKNVVWGMSLPDAEKKNSARHDCQITENGEILYYDNQGREWKHSDSKGQEISLASYAIMLRDLKGKILFEYPPPSSFATEKQIREEFFSSESKGSVEQIGDHFLVNVASGKNSFVGLLDRSGRWIKRKTIGKESQEIKAIPFRDFLQKNLVH